MRLDRSQYVESGLVFTTGAFSSLEGIRVAFESFHREAREQKDGVAMAKIARVVLALDKAQELTTDLGDDFEGKAEVLAHEAKQAEQSP